MTDERRPHLIPGLEELEKELDDRVRKRAYEIWLEEGQPQGRELDHWFRAKQDLTRAAQDQELAESEITSLSESD
jgi:hypothetical protein